MKKGFLSALFSKPRSRRDLELDYINRSVSIYDLERREREVAQGRFRDY